MEEKLSCREPETHLQQRGLDKKWKLWGGLRLGTPVGTETSESYSDGGHYNREQENVVIFKPKLDLYEERDRNSHRRRSPVKLDPRTLRAIGQDLETVDLFDFDLELEVERCVIRGMAVSAASPEPSPPSSGLKAFWKQF